jgi:Mrp family chromosome partitioning ATPase
MLGGRGKLPVLAEIGGPALGGSRARSLRRADLEALGELQGTLAELHVVLVAGEEALAGAVALAAAAGAAGRHTALLECDLARPRLAPDLGLAPVPGLHEYLRWEATATDILQPLVLAGPAAAGSAGPLICVAAGRPARDSATLASFESFRHAIAKLRGGYSLVVLLGPAFDAGDGLLEAVAEGADALIAAVSPAAASGRSARRLQASLRKLPIEARGAIVVGEPEASLRGRSG